MRILPLIFAITFLGFLDTYLIIPIMALYSAELGATIAIIGLIIGMYSIINTPANIFFGLLMDRFGYKTFLVLGLLGDALSMFLYTLSSTPLHLILVRGFHGFTGAILGPATMALVAHYSLSGKSGRSFGFYGMAIGSSIITGFTLTGIIAHRQLGYHIVFYIGSLLLLVGVILALFLPKVSAIGTEKLAVKKIFSLAKRGPIAASYVAVFFQWFIFGAIIVLLPIYMSGFGMTAFHFSMVLLAITLAFIVTQYPFGLLSDKVGRKLPSIIGLAILAISVVLMSILINFKALILTGILCGVGIGSLFPSISAMISDNTNEDERGTATGIFHALITSGVAVGAPFAGLIAKYIGVEFAILLSSVAAIASIFIILRLLRAEGGKSTSSE